ncbi:DUF4099 domain-containing protein [Sphingobacterium suaedae]|uniref:DUF4099 domain-containing protein n=1 Tax=Sphingobacterium suaedae TaxID=1686402 RepID=A0ABW5KNI4_9SPHI
MEYRFNETNLPLEQLTALGLYGENGVYLTRENLDALLAGRRTDLISMTNLHIEGMFIRQMDAKLSLKENADGRTILSIHPIYREPVAHPLLDQKEMEELVSGKKFVIPKEVEVSKNKSRDVLIEYDEQTREFVSYDPAQVSVPLAINGEMLSSKQQLDFKRGEIVTLGDGTRFQHSSVDSKGIRSNNIRLAVSFHNADGPSEFIFRNLGNLKGSSTPQKQSFSKGYTEALTEIMTMELPKKDDPSVKEYIQNQQRLERFNRGEGRSIGR